MGFFAAGAAAPPKASTPPIAIDPRPYSGEGKAEVGIDLTGYKGSLEGKTLSVTLFREGEEPAVVTLGMPSIRPSRRGVMPLTGIPLPPGRYRIRVRLEPDGPEVEAPLVMPEPPPWIHSDAGKTAELLPPWPPIEVSEPEGAVEIRPWGRLYRFEGGPFPSRIVSRGKNLLAAPIAFRARGSPEVAGPPVLRVRGTSEGLVELEALGAAGSLALRARVGIEFDGMIRVDVTLDPQGEARLDALDLVVPLRSERARYLYRYPGRWGSAENAGALPEGGYAGPFQPFIWLGDEERGLAWFCESDAGWSPADPRKAISIAREGGRTAFTLRLIDGPRSIRTPITYTFGFEATPIKPVARDAWDLRIVHRGRYGLERADASGPSELDRLAEAGVRAICFHEQWSPIQNYPKPADPAALRSLVAACHAHRIQLLLYFGYEMSTIAPEWPTFHAECLVDPRRGGYHRKPEQRAYIVCYRSHWQDFLVDGIARIMDAYGIDGVYLDGTANPWPCANVHHGCGYTRPDGSIGPTYPIFAARATMRRIYAVVKARRPEGLVNLHQSTCMTIPSVGWATSYWDGEQFGSIKPGARDPRTLLPLDAFRTEFMGHNWGVPAEFLCYGRPYTYRQALAFTLPHDVPVRPLRLEPDLPLAAGLWRLMDDFGRKEARWIPYWRIREDLGIDAAPGIASAYVREGRGALLVLANLTRTTRRLTIRLDPARIGLAGKALAARDALSGKALPIADGAFTVPVHPLDWIIARVEPK